MHLPLIHPPRPRSMTSPTRRWLRAHPAQPEIVSAVATSKTSILVAFADPSSGQAATRSASTADIRYCELSDSDL